MNISGYSDFCAELLQSGFSLGGGNSKGIYSVIPFGWEQQVEDSPIRWHTGDPLTDPWEWRMRVLEERGDIAYSKVFFNTGGYITAEFYPLFLAVRRHGLRFEQAYGDGTVSYAAKRIYDVISTFGCAAMHDLKRETGFAKQEGSRFDSALIELQMKMFITICGRTQKVNKLGESYGWNSTVLTTTEVFWQRRGVELARVDESDAYSRIRDRVLYLNPSADEKKIAKFIKG